MDHRLRLHMASSSPLEKYPAKQHARRVAALLGVEQGLIYLPGAPTAYLEDSDQFLPLRQRRYFYYLSGVDEPDCHLTYDVGRDLLVLFVPDAGSPRKIIYNGRGPTPEEALEKYDVDAVKSSTSVVDEVDVWMEKHRGDVYILHPSQAVKPGHDKSPRVNYTKLQVAIDTARVRKDAHEIKLIRKANEISAKAHAKVLKNILKFKNESQVEGVFLDTCLAAGAKHQAYEIIAASGENAATLHYIKNDEPLSERQVMCLDAGCEWQCYASDVTRTFPLCGKWISREAKAIYDLVDKIQTSCIQAIRPGVRYLDLHYMAHRILIDGLLQLRILHNGSAQEIFDAGTSLAFLPHGLGHHLGLEVHDVSDVPLMAAGSEDSPVYAPEMCKAPCHPSSGALEEGMIVTVEPGIYFSRYALATLYLPSPIHSKYINKMVLLRYVPVGGVRIEDDILVTDDGYENLTTAPKGEEMLQIIRESLGDKEPMEPIKSVKPTKPVKPAKPAKLTRSAVPLQRLSSDADDLSAVAKLIGGTVDPFTMPSSPGHMPVFNPFDGPIFRDAHALESEPGKTHSAELDGREVSPTVSSNQSRPASLSAAPASFEAVGWPSQEEEKRTAAEFLGKQKASEEKGYPTEDRSSHWRKVPPALARAASMKSLSDRDMYSCSPTALTARNNTSLSRLATNLPPFPLSLPSLEQKRIRPSFWDLPQDLQYCERSVSLEDHSFASCEQTQMFQRPRQAPEPPKKVPELPSKPLAYRQSMPAIRPAPGAPRPPPSRPKSHVLLEGIRGLAPSSERNQRVLPPVGERATGERPAVPQNTVLHTHQLQPGTPFQSFEHRLLPAKDYQTQLLLLEHEGTICRLDRSQTPQERELIKSKRREQQQAQSQQNELPANAPNTVAGLDRTEDRAQQRIQRPRDMYRRTRRSRSESPIDDEERAWLEAHLQAVIEREAADQTEEKKKQFLRAINHEFEMRMKRLILMNRVDGIEEVAPLLEWTEKKRFFNEHLERVEKEIAELNQGTKSANEQPWGSQRRSGYRGVVADRVHGLKLKKKWIEEEMRTGRLEFSLRERCYHALRARPLSVRMSLQDSVELRYPGMEVMSAEWCSEILQRIFG